MPHARPFRNLPRRHLQQDGYIFLPARRHRTAALTNRKSLARRVGHSTDVHRSNVLRFFNDREDGVDTMTDSVPGGKSGVAATATQEWAPREPRPDEGRHINRRSSVSTPVPDGIARGMKFRSWRSCLLIGSLATVMLSTSPSAAVPPGNASTLSALLDLTAARLRIARQVALSKWDSGKPVEDLSRESAVIAAAVKEARANGVPAKLAVHFFTDQIEANKLVQYALLAEWRRSDHAPDDARADLEKEIRPELDRLKGGFIHVLARSGEFRDRTDCGERISRATREYVATHALNSLYALAMDRALARVCERD
ncbi:chorismate mutase [Burkholderia contaminans]|uniref:chorismate mutase n=2 Tax=Burkholderia contaminans TaxID=488447 RepID=UPI003D67A77A